MGTKIDSLLLILIFLSISCSSKKTQESNVIEKLEASFQNDTIFYESPDASVAFEQCDFLKDKIETVSSNFKVTKGYGDGQVILINDWVHTECFSNSFIGFYERPDNWGYEYLFIDEKGVKNELIAKNEFTFEIFNLGSLKIFELSSQITHGGEHLQIVYYVILSESGDWVGSYSISKKSS